MKILFSSNINATFLRTIFCDRKKRGKTVNWDKVATNNLKDLRAARAAPNFSALRI